MRLRTKLFLTWACIMLLLWVGAFWTIQRAVKVRIDLMAHDAFEGTRHGLEGMQKERIARMQQAGRLFTSIPELRALIAEKSSELNSKNRNSLQERLDFLEGLVSISFVAVLDGDARGLALSDRAPWRSVDVWNQYCVTAPQATALLQRIFSPSGAGERTEMGLWPVGGRLYQVVAVPLMFERGDGAVPKGVLVFGEQITDAAASELGRSQRSHITFLADGAVVASSLPRVARTELARLHKSSGWPASAAFVFELNQTLYHGSIQPLVDPSSQSVVGQMLIQSDQQDSAVASSILRTLALIMVSGLLLAAVASFLISAAITHPVQRLVAGVQRVAAGDLELTLPIKRRDELGELSASFNDMVSQLRSRHQLQRQYEEAESASRSKSQFLANMSHEVRTPLNGVIGMTELLMGTALTDQQRRYAGLVRTSAELLTTQINDILDFSKIEAGKLEIECIEFDLHETVEAVVDLLSEKAAKRELDLACHFRPDVPQLVMGDPDRLRQVLVNLINNAIKFTQSGSVVVRIAVQSETGAGMMVRVSVTDTGIGIPKDRMDRLFKPFSQVDASTTRKYGGTGLGLAISKQLSELMGGAIGVESEPNRGSTFWFTVKLQRQAADQASPRLPVAPDGLRVLAVDDSQATRAILEEQLASWGLRAESSDSAAAALGALRQAAASGSPFKVALIDIDMPGTSGIELARAIKADGQLREVVLMAVLPIEAPAHASQLREAGFSEHLTKPVRQSQLYDTIMRAIARERTAPQGAAPVPEPRLPQPGSHNASGRILIAEDNEVNQIVVTELLAKFGYECHVVDNGRKAVEAVFADNFDLILMDCQMPEMDGFDACRAIRQTEAARSRKRIPIIALTANAVKGDREQCLAAGMDGYCSKPIDSRLLLAQIESFLKGASARNGEGHAAEPQPAGGTKGTPFPAIRVDQLLERCLNDLGTIDRVLKKFAHQADVDLRRLQATVASGDLVGTTRTADSLKGAAGMLAADRLAEIASRLEQLGRAKEADQIGPQLSELTEEIGRCLAYLPQARELAAQKLAKEIH